MNCGVHHWLKRRSTREERKPVTRNDNDNNKTISLALTSSKCRYLFMKNGSPLFVSDVRFHLSK
jgi:hypothetical protein